MSLKDMLKKQSVQTAGTEDTLLLFYLPGCPYCRQAERLIGELLQEHPEYADIPLRRVNEVMERPMAESYDYWYTPSLFFNGEKLYEANSADSAETVKRKLNDVFRQALGE